MILFRTESHVPTVPTSHVFISEKYTVFLTHLVFCGTAGIGGKAAISISMLLPTCLTCSICYIRGFASPRHRDGFNFQTAHAIYLILPTRKQIVET